jgi:hypothetical protein
MVNATGGVGRKACKDRIWRQGGVEVVDGHGGRIWGAGGNKISKMLSERKDVRKITQPLVHFIQL